MLYATTASGPHTEATPTATGYCPICTAPVHARCGTINTWHWAHRSGADCDPWSEPTTDWHRAYQRLAAAGRCEVTIGRHRADLVTPDGYVLELQHSSISPVAITERETHYGRMIWLFDARGAYRRGRITLRRGKNDNYVTFRWKHPRRSLAACQRKILLDLGEGLILSVGKLYPDAPCGGWGKLFEISAVWDWLRTGTRPTPLTWHQHRTRDLTTTIQRCYAYLSDPTAPMVEPAAAGRILRAAMCPGDDPTDDVRAALRALQLRGACPPELAAYATTIPVTIADRAPEGALTTACPHCSRHGEPHSTISAGIAVDSGQPAVTSCAWCGNKYVTDVPLPPPATRIRPERTAAADTPCRPRAYRSLSTSRDTRHHVLTQRCVDRPTRIAPSNRPAAPETQD